MGTIYFTRRHQRVSPIPEFCRFGDEQKRKNRLFTTQAIACAVLLVLALIPTRLQAQWKFDMHVQVSGNCSGWGSVAEKNAEAALNHYWNSLPAMIPTKAACESVRAKINGYTSKMDGCTARIICSPCMGRDIGNSMGGVAGDLSYLNNYQLGGVDKGMSSFSSTPADEIAQWEDEFNRKTDIFAYFNGASSGLGYVSTGDSDFDTAYADQMQSSIHILNDVEIVGAGGRSNGTVLPNIREGKFKGTKNEAGANVDHKKIENILQSINKEIEQFIEMSWGSPGEMELSIQSLFNKYFNCDIDKIIKLVDIVRMPTDEESSLYQEYLIFRKEFYKRANAEYIEKIKKINMAENHHVLIAESAYHDENPGDGISMITSNNLSLINESQLNTIQKTKLTRLLDGIDLLNEQGKINGTAVRLYYDSKLQEFVVAFRGTDDINDLLNDICNAGGKLTHQYGSAISLERVIREASESGIKITIVGHSLGGGQASVLGMATGLPTYTYNAAGVSDQVLKHYGILDKKESATSNITAYFSGKDVVSNFQDATNEEEKYNVLVNYAKEHLKEATIGIIAIKAGQKIISLPGFASTFAKVTAITAGTNPGASRSEIEGTFIKAFKETPPAIGNRVNIGDEAGSHPIQDMKNYFVNPKRTYRSDEWKKLTKSQSILSQAEQSLPEPCVIYHQ